jgi:hypothetical protein
MPVSISLTERLNEMQPFSLSGTMPENARIRVDSVALGGTVAKAVTSYPTGAFTWTGPVTPNSKLVALVGLAPAPPGIFPVMGLIPPITRYGPPGEPPKGLRYTIEANGLIVARAEIPRDGLQRWTNVEVDLSGVSGDRVELRFVVEGIFEGPVLPYWGLLRIVPS